MDYHITLDPQFGLSAFDFIITWNALPLCRARALARTAPAIPVRFDAKRITGACVVLSGEEPEGAAGAMCGLIRQVLEKRGARQALEMIQTDLPDGGRGILVKAYC